jgi:peptidoglycan/LPS O-acetylase OafA/YrhL
MDALAWGALLAIVVTGRSASRRVRRAAGIVTPVAAAMFAVEVIHPQLPRGVFVFDANALGVVALTSVVLVAGVVVAPRSLFARALGWGPLAHLGRLSYGIYLWNEFVWHVDMDVFGGSPRDNAVGMVLTIAALLAICELSYRFVEVPLRRRWAHRRTVAPEPQAALARA